MTLSLQIGLSRNVIRISYQYIFVKHVSKARTHNDQGFILLLSGIDILISGLQSLDVPATKFEGIRQLNYSPNPL